MRQDSVVLGRLQALAASAFRSLARTSALATTFCRRRQHRRSDPSSKALFDFQIANDGDRDGIYSRDSPLPRASRADRPSPAGSFGPLAKLQVERAEGLASRSSEPPRVLSASLANLQVERARFFLVRATTPNVRVERLCPPRCSWYHPADERAKSAPTTS